MVDYAPVYLLGNAIVKTPVAGFHMKNRDPSARGYERRQSAVRIAEDQDRGPAYAASRTSSVFGKDLAYLRAERIGLDAEMNIRRAHLKIADEDIAEAFVVILARVHRNVLAVLVEDLHNETQPDDLRPGPENGHYLHKTKGEIKRLICSRSKIS